MDAFPVGKLSIGRLGIGVIPVSSRCLIDPLLQLVIPHLASDQPTENAAGGAIHQGYEVDPVFLCSTNVNSSSSSPTSFSAGSGVAGNRAA